MQMTLARDVPDADRRRAARRSSLELYRPRRPRRSSTCATACSPCIPAGRRSSTACATCSSSPRRRSRRAARVLLDHGNMSSATLPHIWMRILDDPTRPRRARSSRASRSAQASRSAARCSRSDDARPACSSRSRCRRSRCSSTRAWFHRRRGLPRWERIGHPLDTLTIVLLPRLAARRRRALRRSTSRSRSSRRCSSRRTRRFTRGCAAPASTGCTRCCSCCTRSCSPRSRCSGASGQRGMLAGQLARDARVHGVPGRLLEPSARARARARSTTRGTRDLGERWYHAQDTPIALLRAEARHRNPWIADAIARSSAAARACSTSAAARAFSSNYLARARPPRHRPRRDAENLAVARAHDRDGQRRATSSATRARCRYADASFDVVCAMDLLEHVEDPGAARRRGRRACSRPAALFFFHTFNRTWLANLIVIKGVEWFVTNTPDDLHVHRAVPSRPPRSTRCAARTASRSSMLHGSRPRFRWPLWRMLLTGKVGDDFAFTFTQSTRDRLHRLRAAA